MLQDPILLSILFVQALVNIFIIKLWNSPQLSRFHGVYQAEQKIHKGFIPRFGGLAILITFILADCFVIDSSANNDFIHHILICMIPLLFVTFLEDIYNNILPAARLFFIFVSAILILTTGDFVLPVIDLPIVSQFFIDSPWVLILFLTIAMAAMVNAFNLIDGANGLLLFTFLSILGCLMIMAKYIHDTHFIFLTKLLICICLIQLPFNFPKALIFAGDLGAYAFGFTIGILVIIFFGKHPEFLTWQAILILFYPAFEILFTMIRRINQNKKPMQADRLHLHQLIFTLLAKKLQNNILSNALTTVFMFPLWLFAFLWIFIFGAALDFMLVCMGVLINLLLYLIYYQTALNLIKNDQR